MADQAGGCTPDPACGKTAGGNHIAHCTLPTRYNRRYQKSWFPGQSVSTGLTPRGALPGPYFPGMEGTMQSMTELLVAATMLIVAASMLLIAWRSRRR
jgi:hypothetical protein